MGAVHRDSDSLLVLCRLNICIDALNGELTQTHIVPGSTLASIVIGGQTESIQQQRLTDELHIVIGIT